MQTIEKERYDRLLQALLQQKTPEAMQNFLEDLCTIKELQDMAQRLAVAAMLAAGRSYADISRETGASTATVSRVNRCLHYGAGGYAAALGVKNGQSEKETAQ